MGKLKNNGFAFLVYPDSMRKDTLEWLLRWFPCAISPLHNRDRFEDGTLKKPHYHVLVTGSLTAEQKRWIFSYTQSTYFEGVHDLYSYYNYLYHWDTKNNWYIKNKAQYWSADISHGTTFNKDLLRFNTDANDYMKFALSEINRLCMFEWSDFVDYIFSLPDFDLQTFVMKNSNFLKSYIDSKRYKSVNSIKSFT